MSARLYLNKIKIRFKRSFIRTLAAQLKSKFYTRHEPAPKAIRAALFMMLFLKLKSNGCFGNESANERWGEFRIKQTIVCGKKNHGLSVRQTSPPKPREIYTCQIGFKAKKRMPL